MNGLFAPLVARLRRQIGSPIMAAITRPHAAAPADLMPSVDEQAALDRGPEFQNRVFGEGPEAFDMVKVTSGDIAFLGMAETPGNGLLHLLYLRNLGGGNQQIEHAVSSDRGRTWAIRYPAWDIDQNITNCRIAAGPTLVHAFYSTIYPLGGGYYDWRLRHVKTGSDGMAWGLSSVVRNGPADIVPPSTATGIAKPALAVDEGDDPHLLWAESDVRLGHEVERLSYQGPAGGATIAEVFGGVPAGLQFWPAEVAGLASGAGHGPDAVVVYSEGLVAGTHRWWQATGGSGLFFSSSPGEPILDKWFLAAAGGLVSALYDRIEPPAYSTTLLKALVFDPVHHSWTAAKTVAADISPFYTGGRQAGSSAGGDHLRVCFPDTTAPGASIYYAKGEGLFTRKVVDAARPQPLDPPYEPEAGDLLAPALYQDNGHAAPAVVSGRYFYCALLQRKWDTGDQVLYCGRVRNVRR